MDYTEFVEKYQSSYSDTIRSEREWNTGGTVGSCWGTRQVEFEMAPDTFEELNDFLDEIDPEMDENVKQEIFEKCVTIEHDHEHDWYGGKRYYSYYKIQIIDIYSELDDRNLLTY